MTPDTLTAQLTSSAPAPSAVVTPSPAPASVAAVALAATALVGRAITFIVAGPTPLGQLIMILLIAISVLLLARHASQQGNLGAIEQKLLKMANRIGIIQVGLSVWLLAAAGWIV